MITCGTCVIIGVQLGDHQHHQRHARAVDFYGFGQWEGSHGRWAEDIVVLGWTIPRCCTCSCTRLLSLTNKVMRTCKNTTDLNISTVLIGSQGQGA